MATFVEFKLEAGGEIWVDADKVKAVTNAFDGGARLWVGGGDFFEVAASVAEVMSIIRGERSAANGSTVRHLHPVTVD